VSVSPISVDHVLMTAEGFEELCRELERLKEGERRRLSALLSEARRDGALDDNPALADLLDDQARLEHRIALLQAQLACAEIAPPPSDAHAGVGSRVRVRDVATGEVLEHQLVGPLEGDPANGRLSIVAPIGRALLGRRRGARVEVETPGGLRMLDVLSVSKDVPATKAA
jgi:transcription elongation factor GreA